MSDHHEDHEPEAHAEEMHDGEHGGEASSVQFCHQVGMDYVSCSPYRVPIARLAAAQAVIASGDGGTKTRSKGKARATRAKAKAKPSTGRKTARPAKRKK